jgi:20S proteasome alpha/beta subunit
MSEARYVSARLTTGQHPLNAQLQLATALRKAPFNVNVLLAGVDKDKDEDEGAAAPSLFWIDYLGAMTAVKYGAHGYGAYFTNGLLDRNWKPKMSHDEAVELMGKCIAELRMRFMLNQPAFACYKVDTDGIHAVEVSVPTLPDVSLVPASTLTAASSSVRPPPPSSSSSSSAAAAAATT